MISREDIAVVVVWYNPVQKFVQNTLSYSRLFRKVYIVDNSPEDNLELAAQIADCEYIPNHANLGIAAALNTGCRKSMDDGFLWCMTMDQDSVWDSSQLDGYINTAIDEINRDDRIKSVAPRFVCPEMHSVLGIIKRKLYRLVTGRTFTEPPVKTEPEFVDRVICSGNLIELEAWRMTDGFNELLFIDEVDHEFCYRLRRHGLKILQLNQFYLCHFLGDGFKRPPLLPKSFDHSSFRLFYMFRNKLYIIRTYPTMARKFNEKKNLMKMIFHTCIINKNAFKNIGIFAKAVSDYKKFFL